MNLNLLGNLIIWCLFPLALVCVIAFASNIHEEFVNERRRKQSTRPIANIFPTSYLQPQPQREQPVLDNAIIRAYDSPELFREDLWLLRIDRSRKAHAALTGWVPLLEANLKIPADRGKSICALLAQHAGARCDN